MTDEEIDTSDIPPLDEAFFADAKLRVPGKVSVTVNVDADVLEWFRAQGEEFQQRINAALRIYAEAHKEQWR
ncbi:MAG TPA: BrnA antitoxin family protein [Pyrinomonadaceae bacterium]|nr:BrnA antitoxin family protein [Pyrinomonadaceae bacterium]